MNPQVTLANWRSAPYNRWAFHHVRELIPTADIPNDPARVAPLPAQPADFPFDDFLAATDTDGLAIVHRGKLVFERYANGMTPETPHILMSVSKSMRGLLFGRLGLDPERKVTDVLPPPVRSSNTARPPAGTRSRREKSPPTCIRSTSTLPSGTASTAGASITCRPIPISSAG